MSKSSLWKTICLLCVSCAATAIALPAQTFKTLFSFDGTDGANPDAALVQATDGNLYGTTIEGGANGWGTVFKTTPSGTLTTLYSFCSKTGCTDGIYPDAVLVQRTDGNFYGTTQEGGANSCIIFSGADVGCGTVFKITPGGTLTTLHSFDGTDGELPAGGLVQATNGNFYGTTFGGGANDNCAPFNGCGTVFKITPGGTLTTLHSFCSQSGCTDGLEPGAAVVQDTNGELYGTTFHGGTNGDGTAFSLSVDLGPFLETRPTSGKVGAAVIILGTNLTGATSVTFNGTPATPFTVNSTGTAITTTVPSGATTGKVKVVTPKRTLSSNVRFRVVP